MNAREENIDVPILLGHMKLKVRTRRQAIFTGGAIAATSMLRPSAAAQFVYKLAHQQSLEFPLHVRTVQMVNAIRAETNGRMEIQIFPNSILGGQTSLLGQVRLGSIQFLNLGDANYTPVVPAFGVEAVGFAFNSFYQPLKAYSGPLGAYIRREFAAKGLYAFDGVFGVGFRQLTSSTKPIKTADDLTGFRVRIVPAPIILDFFRTLGASPTAIDSNEMYTALQTRVVDGQDGPLATIESFKLYEVQKFLSITNHTWTGNSYVANGQAWEALPSDVQDIIRRNVKKYALLGSKDVDLTNGAVFDKLKRQGLVANAADVNSMRRRLGSYYSRWKAELGATLWNLLEDAVGKLT